MRNRFRVLIVDDEVASVEALSRFLTRSGYQVMATTCLEKALELDATDPADVLITDLRMPKGHGLDLVAALRQRRPGTPVIITTGWGDDASSLLAEEPADTVLLHKPVDPLHLRDFLKAMTEAARPPS